MFPNGGPLPPNQYNPYGPPLPNNGNYTPPAAGTVPQLPVNTPGMFQPPPPNGWPANLPWQGQPPGQTGGYGGYPGGYGAPGGGGGGGGGGGAGGGGGPELWNGYEILMRGPGGNVLVSYNGVPTAFDAWGNLIPHLNAGYELDGSPSPQAPATTPAAGVPAPGPSGPATFYAPTTGSPYLQLPGNWLAYLSPEQRNELNNGLLGAGFAPTGAMSTYGPSDYIRPSQFNDADFAAITQNQTLRDWLRFFSGNYGYGISYQLPASYAGGIPTPPPIPMGGTGS